MRGAAFCKFKILPYKLLYWNTLNCYSCFIEISPRKLTNDIEQHHLVRVILAFCQMKIPLASAKQLSDVKF